MPILKDLNPRLGGKPFGSKQPWKLETNYLFVLGFHIIVVPVGGTIMWGILVIHYEITGFHRFFHNLEHSLVHLNGKVFHAIK